MDELKCPICLHKLEHHIWPGCNFPFQHVVPPGIVVEVCGCTEFLPESV